MLSLFARQPFHLRATEVQSYPVIDIAASSMPDSVMIEFKPKPADSEVDNIAGVEEDAAPPANDGKLSLTRLWEIIVRTNRLPDDFDVKVLFTGFRERLCDPEKEVRQHALRVLSDLIPLLDPNTLDDNMKLILTEIVTNLGYSAPSVRKSAIDCLKVYLKFSETSNEVLRDLVSRGIENSVPNEVPVNTVLGIIMSLHHLLTDKINDTSISYVIQQLFSKAAQLIFQETALKSLMRIRRKIGCEKFSSFLGENVNQEFHNLCEIYNLHESPETILASASREAANWSDSRSDSFTDPELAQDKVILETEIKLNSGSAITMKIHEESRPNSANGVSDSDEDHAMRHGSAVLRVLSEDSEQEYYESKRTPRRVHFGGEVVKMRTPESDSNQPSDDNETIIIERGSSIHITVRDGVSSVKTKTKHTHKSMIPVKVRHHSEPSTPEKKLKPSKRRLHKSAPDLTIKSRTITSRIPLRSLQGDIVRVKKDAKKGRKQEVSQERTGDKKDSKNVQNTKTESQKEREVVVTKQSVGTVAENSSDTLEKPNPQDESQVVKPETPKDKDLLAVETARGRPRRNSRTDRFSPVPVHNEIELLHNLMRSPQRVKRDTSQEPSVSEERTVDSKGPVRSEEDSSETKSDSEQRGLLAVNYDSFRIYQDTSIDASSSKEEDNVTNGETSNENAQLESSSEAVNHKSDSEGQNPQGGNVVYTNAQVHKDSDERTVRDQNGNEDERNDRKRDIQKPVPESSTKIVTDFTSFKICTENLRLKEVKPEETDTTKQSERASITQVVTEDCHSRPSSKCEQRKAHEDSSPLEPSILNDLCCKEDLSARSRGLENLIMSLKWPETCPSLDTAPALLLLHVLFSCEQQFRLQSQAQEALQILLTNMSHDVLKNCLKQVVHGLSKMGSPDGIRLAVLVMQRVTPSIFIRHLVSENHHRTSSRAREGTLQLLIAACRTFPSCDIDVTRGSQLATKMLKDRKRRVRQAALEALACLAQVSSNADVLDIAANTVKDQDDSEKTLQVIRTRLSRKQLPLVDGNGNIRYTPPREQIESDWLSNATINNNQPMDDSMIQPKTTPLNNNDNINYWRQHSRQKADALLPASDSNQQNSDSDWSEGQKDKSLNDNSAQIWAIDPSGFPGQNKYNSNGNLRPLYIVQPDVFSKDKSNTLESETPSNRHASPMSYRRYDRGRSFSPSKDTYRNINGASNRLDNVARDSDDTLTRRRQRMAKHKDVFRKSFSSEQLYSNTNKLQDNYSFSLSSGSSSTSTGSYSRRGNWSRDFKSSIPIPIHPDHKLRLRVARNQSTVTAPLIAQEPIREKLPSPRTTPILCRLSPVKQHPSSPAAGSESSGYVTPPAEQQLNDQPFIRLDSDDQSEVDNVPPADDYQIIETIECEIETKITTTTVSRERKPSSSSSETSEDPVAHEPHERHEEHENHDSDHAEVEIRLKRESTSNSLNESELRDTPRSFTEHRNKSKSEVDLKQTILPDIGNRKNINSAPALNKSPEKLYTFEQLPQATPKLSLPGSIPTHEDDIEEGVVSSSNSERAEVKEAPRRLTRRLSNRQMLARRSSKSSRVEQVFHQGGSRPLSKSKEGLQDVLRQLDSNEWEITMRGLQGLVRIAKHNPELIESQIHSVCVTLGKQIKNLRSQVARAACVAASEIFEHCKKGLDVEIDELAGPLLQRTADTNKFLRNDANVALDGMSCQLPTHRVVHVVANRGCCHQNGVVRASAVRILSELAHRLGPDKVYQLPRDVRDRLLVCGATALTEGSLECRRHGKDMLALLSDHPHFQKSLLEAVPAHVLRHIGKALKSLK